MSERLEGLSLSLSHTLPHSHKTLRENFPGHSQQLGKYIPRKISPKIYTQILSTISNSHRERKFENYVPKCKTSIRWETDGYSEEEEEEEAEEVTGGFDRINITTTTRTRTRTTTRRSSVHGVTRSTPSSATTTTTTCHSHVTSVRAAVATGLKAVSSVTFRSAEAAVRPSGLSRSLIRLTCQHPSSSSRNNNNSRSESERESRRTLILAVRVQASLLRTLLQRRSRR